MNIFLTTLEATVILLGIGIIGFFLIQRKILAEKALTALSPVALELALPCLIFTNIITQFTPSDYSEWWLLPAWWFFFTVIAAGITSISSFTSTKKIRREFALALFYQNGIFFPIALLGGMFGSDSLYVTSLFIFTLLYPAFFFNTYTLFFPSSQKKTTMEKNLSPRTYCHHSCYGFTSFWNTSTRS